MPGDKVFSVRNPLQGELHDFITSSGFDCQYIANAIRDFLCQLSNYREEGIALFPEVFIVPNSESITSLSPGTQRVKVGERLLDETAAAAVLKDCAGLAHNGWAIYICKMQDDPKPPKVEFGVFRALKHAYAGTAEESMIASPDSAAVLIRNRGNLVIEIVNSKQETFTASFTSAEPAKSAFSEHVGQFAEAICHSLSSEARDLFHPYLKRSLVDALQRCHGTLLAACVPPADGAAPESLMDGVWLAIPLDLSGIHAAAVMSKDAESLAALQSFESLLQGMINSDGVVIFGTDGSLLGYRVFLKPSEDEKKAASHKGGGRRRTYELMKGRLGDQLKAAFFRSQDGKTACEKVG